MTLTELSYYSRKIFPLAIIGFLLFLIFFYLIKLFILLYTPPPKPTIFYNPIFQKISRPKVIELSSTSGINFVLDTIEGHPKTATLAAKVFFLPKPVSRLNYKTTIYLMAKNFGFDTEKTKHKLKENLAIFSDEEKKLEIDITNYNFFFDYQFATKADIFENTIIPSKKEIENRAVEFLKTVNLYPEELAKGKISIFYFYYQKDLNTFSKVDDVNQANVVEVDFLRDDIDDYPVISPKFPNSHNFVLMTFYQDDYKVLRAQIKFFEKSEGEVGIYPLKSGDLAWEELTKGKGIVLSNPKEKKEVVIKQMSLAYLDLDFYQPYLQPVYLFIGEDNFSAFVPAVSFDYLID